jgi:hypothetical protein
MRSSSSFCADDALTNVTKEKPRYLPSRSFITSTDATSPNLLVCMFMYVCMDASVVKGNHGICRVALSLRRLKLLHRICRCACVCTCVCMCVHTGVMKDVRHLAVLHTHVCMYICMYVCIWFCYVK